ncbi:hypothetical protein U3516DRAFT_53028 [Neocallimastix sp. 'constans']
MKFIKEIWLYELNKMRRVRVPMDSSFDPSIFNAPLTSDISLTSLSQSSINPNSNNLTITGNYY